MALVINESITIYVHNLAEIMMELSIWQAYNSIVIRGSENSKSFSTLVESVVVLLQIRKKVEIWG